MVQKQHGQQKEYQSVPGALLNQAALEGKPSYFSQGKSYLPKGFFSENIKTFFSNARQNSHNKHELGLNEERASTHCATLLVS